MDQASMKKRTKGFWIDVYRFCLSQLTSSDFQDLRRQLLRAAMSVGANYRAACRAKSRADFIYKLKLVEEECDESLFFMEVLLAIDPHFETLLKPIYKEGNELLAILVATINRLRANRKS